MKFFFPLGEWSIKLVEKKEKTIFMNISNDLIVFTLL